MYIDPITKVVVTPVFWGQIEKFKCLKLSTAQGLLCGAFSYHMTRVTFLETCLEVSEL